MIKDVPSIFSNTFPKLLMLILKEKILFDILSWPAKEMETYSAIFS